MLAAERSYVTIVYYGFFLFMDMKKEENDGNVRKKQ